VCTTAATKPMAAAKPQRSTARALGTPSLLLIADPDARPATAKLSPHREQPPRARQRRPPPPQERSSRAAVYSDWARTLPQFYRSLALPSLADGVMGLKQEHVCLNFGVTVIIAAL